MLAAVLYSVVGLLRYRWTYLFAGAILGCLGLITYISAHPSKPVEIDGTEASYLEVTKGSSYDRNELQLQGDSNTYTLDKYSFHPALPEEVYKGGKMQIWVDQGTTRILAITLYDENDANPVTYTTDAFDNPKSETSSSQTTGIELGVAGAVLIAIFGVWSLVLRRRQAPIGAGAGLAPGTAMSSSAGTSAGVSSDGKWYWDGSEWQRVSDDGRFRWDGTQWIEMGIVYSAKGAPPPPSE